jgi:uncharacterized protein
LGFLYHNGNGLPQDESQGTTWMLKAAEQGETKAQFNLGALLCKWSWGKPGFE